MRSEVITVSAGNALEATGAPWHWWRRHAAELGIPIVQLGSKSFMRASDVLAAMEKRAAQPAAEVDDLAEFRARVARAG